jgi:short-subunit dehydrogenase
LVADLSDAKGVESIAKELRSGGYDLLVNNAGVGLYGSFDKVPVERQLQAMHLNCDAVVALAHAYLQSAKQGDALINVSSTLGFNGFPYSSVYAASKAFVLSFSESLWFEMKDRGVYVMALCPGVTSSHFHEAAGGRSDNKPPQAITQTPEAVAEEALRGLKARCKPTVISGAANRFRGFVTNRVMTRKRAISLMGGFGSQLKSK